MQELLRRLVGLLMVWFSEVFELVNTTSDPFSSTVQSSQNSVPEPPADFKLREDHLSGSTIKGETYSTAFSTIKL